MKVSKYNVVVEKDGRFFVYNQLRSSLLEIDKELSQALKSCNIDSISCDIISSLSINGIVCPSSLREEYVLLAQNRHFRFSNSLVRVTIMPTLNCNFHCWYCYEQHHQSCMQKSKISDILIFCRSLIKQTCTKKFQLDWFGGEPLLYFKEVVYPISLVIKEFCRKENIEFLNTITTNGYCISREMIDDMKRINLTGFQITLDGDRKYHNLVRFTSSHKESFDIIVNNIISLCRNIQDVNMTVRINYTPSNVNSIAKIGDAFPEDIRGKIQFSPQMVWQYKDKAHLYADVVNETNKRFVKIGYKKTVVKLSCSSCYAENMKQYVINYDLKVYKCTARDFKEEYSVGKILAGGFFEPSSHYFDFFVPSGMENERCLECRFLPSCMGDCIQKTIEGHDVSCNLELFQKELENRILLYLIQTGIL